ncbi:MAG: superoxide dismutase [Patescibacteria group bacterium]|mgnify:CR=1 FL=1
MEKFYSLPGLSYGYGELAPYISEEQLKTHYEKHHAGYVGGANLILEKLDKSKSEELDLKCASKVFGFNVGGFVLHSLFWKNLAPKHKGGGGLPKGRIAKEIGKNFGSFDKFKEDFTRLAMSAEGSGWAALAYCEMTERLIPMQIEKHNVNIYPTLRIVMVLDAFEHAYYIDYRNEKNKFFEAFWEIVDWEEVNRRLENIQG